MVRQTSAAEFASSDANVGHLRMPDSLNYQFVLDRTLGEKIFFAEAIGHGGIGALECFYAE
ncbi:MAG: hypothetical protein Fur0021_31840 [Candidatus Promineifilaceae bacterium]